MKDGDDARLKFGAEIDEQVTARNQIDTRKWRILDDAVRRKNAQIANVFIHRITDIVSGEIPFQSLFGDVLQKRFGISSRSRHDQRVLVNVGGKQLHLG